MSGGPSQDTGGNTSFYPSSCNINDISLISIYWSDIINKPSFCNISITGSYNDLINTPSLCNVIFSGDYNSLSNKTWINSNCNIYNNNYGNIGIGTNNPISKLHLIGNLLIEGDIIPTINSNFNLGNSNFKWKDIYLSGNSIFLDNLILSKNNSNNLEIKDTNNNFRNISANSILLNNSNDILILELSNGSLIYTSNNTKYFSIPFSDYSQIIYSNVLNNTSNSIINYTNDRIANININGGTGTINSININTDTIPIGSSNKFITSNIYNNNITFTSNVNVTGNYQLNNCNIPFSLINYTSVKFSNGNFNYNSSSNNFGYISFVNNGSIIFPQTTSCDILIVGAGGNGGLGSFSGGGGAGEIIAYPNYIFNRGTYNIDIGLSSFNSNLRISKITSNSFSIFAIGGGSGAYSNVNPESGGSGGGGYLNIINGAIAGNSYYTNNTYSFVKNGSNGTINSGGNGGNISYISTITGSSLIVGEGGTGATSSSIPIVKNTYGSGGDGNGGIGTNGLVIIKIPLDTCNLKFDGFIYSSNIFDLNLNIINNISIASNQLYSTIINTSNQLIDYDNLNDKPWINSGLNIYNNNQGNIGIGKTNPLYKLDVNGDINLSGNLRLNNSILPFSVYSNTNIISSNGLFSYIPNNITSAYYTFLTNGSITFPQTTLCDILVVGQGGNGGMGIYTGGGGAGEVIAISSYSFPLGTYNIQMDTSNSIISRNNSNLIVARGGGNSLNLIEIVPTISGDFNTSNFTSSNMFYTFKSGTSTFTINNNIICDILLVGGGGGGGTDVGGGGGAGAVLFTSNFLLPSGTYSIIVGSGGQGSITSATVGSSGGNTSMTINGTNYIAVGGGGGGSRVSGSSGISGANGGSGGGASHSDVNAVNDGGLSIKNNYTGWLSYGNIGGFGKDTYTNGYAGGGGGGAGSKGADAVTSFAGNGGFGINMSSNFGTMVGHNGWFAGGGGSAAAFSSTAGIGNGGNGFFGGGGKGTIAGEATFSGLPNTGGGGGGAGYSGNTLTRAGAGGSGVAIIKFNKYIITSNLSLIGGSGSGGISLFVSDNSNGNSAGTKWDISNSYINAGTSGTLLKGGDGGSALITGGYTETITSNNLIVGVGGIGATSNSIPRLINTYGSGGDGNGGLGTEGIIIIKVPLNIQRSRFDGYINYSNIDNRPVLNDLITTNNYLNLGYYNQVNFPLANVAWKNEWFLYVGNSPANQSNSFIFWHLTSNINSKWWFNGTQTITNSEISDIRIKKDIIDIQNPLEKLMFLKPKEYYLCDEKDYLRKYGIIAQDVYDKPELNHLVYKDEDYIANIYINAIYVEIVEQSKILLITNEIISNKIQINDELKILLDNINIDNKEIIIEETPYHNRYKKRYAKVKSIIDDYTIEIYDTIELSENEKNNLFIYGKKVNDFNKLDYSSLYSLNIACSQELYKLVQEQKVKIDILEQKIIELENKMI